jgi:hypothetical protein
MRNEPTVSRETSDQALRRSGTPSPGFWELIPCFQRFDARVSVQIPASKRVGHRFLKTKRLGPRAEGLRGQLQVPAALLSSARQIVPLLSITTSIDICWNFSANCRKNISGLPSAGRSRCSPPLVLLHRKGIDRIRAVEECVAIGAGSEFLASAGQMESMDLRESLSFPDLVERLVSGITYNQRFLPRDAAWDNIAV